MANPAGTIELTLMVFGAASFSNRRRDTQSHQFQTADEHATSDAFGPMPMLFPEVLYKRLQKILNHF